LDDYSQYETNLAISEVAQQWLLDERGIDYETCKFLHLGYRDCIEAKAPELLDVVNGGWVVFPSIVGDRVVMLKYRSIARKAFARQPGMKTSLFNAAAIDWVDDWYATGVDDWYASEDVYITEGEFDAAVLVQAHLRAVSIGSSSTPVTASMIDQIKKAKRVVLAGDNDGGVGSKKMADLQSQLPGSILLKWPCKDANELWLRDHKEDAEGFASRVIGLTVEAEREAV
jgi:hypothetical protein